MVNNQFEYDFHFAFAISFSDKTLQLRSLSGLVCGEQDLFKTKCSKEKCILRRLHNSMEKRNPSNDSRL